METRMRGAALCCLLLILLPTSPAGAEDDGRLLVDAPCGKVRGKVVRPKHTSREVHAFLGIPFAEPPVGELRFADPRPATPWSGVREATEQPPMCPQDPKFRNSFLPYGSGEISFPTLSEDCLYLNVFTPADRDCDEKLPVMVFIHGGSFVFGGAIMFDGTALSARENVIQVTLQYRLGVLGFLSSDIELLSGNYGLLDQVEGLRWVNNNIKSFGGDPDRVTIFGESAGGTSVSILASSPMTKGLIHGAIAQSGTGLIHGLVARTPEQIDSFQNKVSEASGCDKMALMECLMEKTEEDMLDLAVALNVLPLPIPVDGKILHKPVEEILEGGEMLPIPFMTGIMNNECGFLIPMTFGLSGLLGGMDRETAVQLLQSNPFLKVPENWIQPLMDRYFGNETDPGKIRNSFLDMCRDNVFAIPAMKTANYYRDAGLPTFVYRFDHGPLRFKGIKPDFADADHGDDLFFSLGGAYLPDGLIFSGDMEEEERKLCDEVMGYFAEFARAGDPNGADRAEWPLYSNELLIMKMNFTMESEKWMEEQEFQFWKTLP